MAIETNDVIVNALILVSATGLYIVKEPATIVIPVNHAKRP